MNMVMKILIFVTLVGVTSLLYFYSKVPTPISYDFYHWRTIYNVENTTTAPRYVKVLDITYGKTLALKKTLFKSVPAHFIVPVIYIDNPLWEEMKAFSMASKVLNALKNMPIKYDEIQIDCDWTPKSKKRYFKFLKLLKEQSSKKISATIRLHQVKYHKRTGVPPVDYGVLMYYNMSDFRDLETKNYILDLELAKRYHYNFESYPLMLNLALPLYAQATIIRFSKVVGVIEGLREKELNSSNFKKIKNHLYEVQMRHYFKGRLFYKGDRVRVDEVSLKMLEQSILSLKVVMKKPKEVIFYRWGNKEEYDVQKLQEILMF